MASSSTPVDFSKPLDHSVLEGRTALVTGGASGIGAGIVKALAAAGCWVAIADLNQSAGERLSHNLSREGYSVSFLQVDVSDWHSQLAAFKQIIAHRGNIDIVIASAGIAGPSILQDAPFNKPNSSGDPDPPDMQIRMINVNLVGPIYTATLAAHCWNMNPQAAALDNNLVLIASNIAYFPTPGFTGYSAAKMGVRGLWKSLRHTPRFVELFRTNLLAPHIVRSPMTAGLQPLLDERGLQFVEIQDCVDCLVRVCCDQSIRSRAIGVNPAGSWFDMHDDLEDYDGAKMFKEHYEETKDVFDFLDPGLSMS